MEKIGFKYSLTEKQVKNGLYAAKIIKKELLYKSVMTLVFVLLIVNFTQQYIYPATGGQKIVLGVFLIALSAALGIYLWIRPLSAKEKALIATYYEGNSFTVEADSNAVSFTNKAGEKFEIPLDGKATCKTAGDIIVIQTAGGNPFFVPISVLDKNIDIKNRFLELCKKGMTAAK